MSRSFLFFYLSASMRPNIFLGVSEGSAQYKKWYYELVIDQVDHFVTSEPSHLRVGWANTKGYAPYPGGGEGWGGNGVGDDLYSFGFDGLQLWSGRWVGQRVDFFFSLKRLKDKIFTDSEKVMKYYIIKRNNARPIMFYCVF